MNISFMTQLKKFKYCTNICIYCEGCINYIIYNFNIGSGSAWYREVEREGAGTTGSAWYRGVEREGAGTTSMDNFRWW